MRNTKQNTNGNGRRVFFYALAVLDCALVANVLLSAAKFFV